MFKIPAKNLWMVILLMMPAAAASQSYFNTGSSGMGDTGITHINNSSSAFINPANLMLAGGPGNWDVSILTGEYYYNRGFFTSSATSPGNYFTPFDPTSYTTGFLTVADANTLVESWFGPDDLKSTGEKVLDIQTLGIGYKSRDFAMALNHRIRGHSYSEIGRGWFESNFRNTEGVYLLDRTLNHELSIRHEISLGFAWEQGLISGLLGTRSNIYLGVNPKIILPVAYARHNMSSLYAWEEDNPAQIQHLTEYSGASAGEYTAEFRDFESRRASSVPVIQPDYFDITGVGFGFDAGVTWRLIMGENITMRSDNRVDSDYHLSLSLTVQDIGFISHGNQSARYSGSNQNIFPTILIEPAGKEFTGSMNDFIDFAAYDGGRVFEDLSVKEGRINVITPSSLTAGIGLQLDQLLLALEYKQHTGNSFSRSDFSTIHIGNEVRLFSLLALRSGIILHSNEPVTYSAGIGLETTYFSLSAGTYARQIDNIDHFRPVLMKVGTLAVRF